METINILIITGIVLVIQMLFFPQKNKEKDVTKDISKLNEEINRIQSTLTKIEAYLKNINIKEKISNPKNKVIQNNNTQSYDELYDSVSEHLTELIAKTELKLKNIIEGIKYLNRANTLNIYTLEDFETEHINQQENIIEK